MKVVALLAAWLVPMAAAMKVDALLAAWLVPMAAAKSTAVTLLICFVS